MSPAYCRLCAAEGHYDAVVGCFVDSAVREARTATTVRVIGPGQSSVALAQTLGQSFGVVTIPPSNAPDIEHLIHGMQLGHKCAGVENVGLESDAVTEAPEHAFVRTHAAALCLLERGAQAILLGDLSYSFSEFVSELGPRLRASVVDPLRSAIAVAHAHVSMGVRPSSRAHPHIEATVALHEYLDNLVQAS
jgi:allantoin racemase